MVICMIVILKENKNVNAIKFFIGNMVSALNYNVSRFKKLLARIIK